MGIIINDKNKFRKKGLILLYSFCLIQLSANNLHPTETLTGFTFDCNTAAITGSFYASGVSQSGYITLRISNVVAGTTSIAVTNASGFSGGIASTTLVATQTSIQIPISFSGSSAVGTYTLVLSSPNANNTCNISVPVAACSAYKPVILNNVPTTLCLGDSIKMTASSGIRYTWNTGETTASILKKTAGNYSVTVTYNGCTGSTSQTVSYNSNCVAGLCSGVLSSEAYKITFGTGGRTSLPNAVAGATTTHVYSPSGLIVDGQYAVANNATDAGGWAVNTPDHSGDGATGRMMVINADNTPKECFRLPVSGLCSNLKYQFSAWIKSISNKPEKPNVTLEVRDIATDSLLAIKGTGDVPFGDWIQYGLTFETPNNPNLYVVLKNNTVGGLNGNDLVIDDIQFAYCGPPVVTSMQGGTFNVATGEGSTCKGNTITLSSNVTSGFINIPVYQWQESLDNGATWRNIVGATTLNYSFVADTVYSNRRFKMLVAEVGKITTPSCRAESNVVIFRYQSNLSTIAVSSNIACVGDSILLTATNGATYLWNTGETTASVYKKTSGTYAVTITDAGGCVANASKTISFKNKPIATITTVGEANVNSGGTATLTASTGTSYLWNTGDTNAAISVNQAGTYYVTITNSDGCSAVASKTIGTNQSPQLSNSTANVIGNRVYSGTVANNASDPDGNLNPNSFAVTDNPKHGTIVMNPNGTYSYTPTANFSGIDSVHFRVCDLGGLCITATIIFSVTVGTNQAPILTNANLVTLEDVVLVGTVRAHASDIDNNLDSTSFIKTDNPKNGTFILNPNGTFTYTPNPNFNGLDSVHYRVCDVQNACSSAAIFITINAVNDPPVLTNSTPSVQEDIPISGNVSPNASDIDPNLDNNSFAVVDNPLHGTITMSPNGAYTYTPNPNFNGIDSVHFKVCDLSGACATATLIFTVAPVNDAPILTNATGTLQEDASFTGTVQPNATDVDGNLNPNSFVLLDNSLNGTLILNINGAYTYTPKPNFNGIDSAHYRVCDALGACASATIILTVTSVNDKPTVSNASNNTSEDTPVTGTVANTATDVDGNINPNGFSTTDTPKNGTIVMNPNGTYTYTPKPNFNGIDSVHYQACDSTNICTVATLIFTVTPVNDAPTLNNANSTVVEDTPFIGNVAANATDADGNLNPNSFGVINRPVNGTIVMNPNGTYTYTPNPNFNGADSVQYKVCDMSGACTTATIFFTVIPVNDPPTLLNATPSIDEDTPITSSVFPNASDIDNNLNPNSFAVLNAPAHGTIIMQPNGTYTYTPTLDYVGVDSIKYQVCDFSGTCKTAYIIINVSSVNDAPTLTNATPSVLEDAVLSGTVFPNAHDIDKNLNPNSFTVLDKPLHGIIVMQPNGAYIYTPSPNFNGIDSLHYQVCDSAKACATATFIITVTPVNDAPTLTNATPSVPEDAILTGTVLPNAFDIDGNLNPNSFSLLDNPKNGTIRFNPNGSYTYTPNPNFFGVDSVHYQVCDFSGTCTQATLIITVTPVNDPPTLSNATPSVDEDAILNGSVANNAKDPDNNLNPNSFSLIDKPLNGIIDMQANGTYTYKPRPNFYGVDSVRYQVCDSSGVCTSAILIITVNPVNDPPKTSITAPVVMEDTPVTFCGFINDVDGNDVFNTRLCNQPKGLIKPNITENRLCIDYKPQKDFNGQDTICILVCDRGGLCDTVKIPITVVPVNDAPVLTVNPITVPADSTIIQCFLIQDADAFDSHTASFCDVPKGIASVKVENGNVCVTYKTFFPNFENDALCIIVCDKAGACSQTYIPVTVTPCDDKLPPTLTCPTAIEVSSIGEVISDPSKFITQSTLADNCNGVILGFKLPAVKDDCSVPFVQQTEGIKSGNIFPKGISSIGFEALDNSGKKSTCRVEINVSNFQLLTPDLMNACIGETLNLEAKYINNAIYTWKTPQNALSYNSTLTLPVSTNTQSGTYTITTTLINRCVIKDSILLKVNSAPKVVNDSFSVESGGIISNNVLKNDGIASTLTYNLKIKDNVFDGTLSLKNDGSFTYQPRAGFTGRDNFIYEICTDICPNTCQRGTAILNVLDAAPKQVLDEVITPNNDGVNDALIVEGLDINDPKNKSSLFIFNQWGEIVHKASPYLNNWKGTYNDVPLPQGTYYVIFKITPESEPVKTFVTILR
jgi:gliding motility-associated-like protein